MAKMKQLILLLVEGITDKVALEAIISPLIENDDIAFQLTYGDVATKEGVTAQNILSEVETHVEYFLANEHFKEENILKIVHLVDTDGAFIDEKLVVYNDINHIQYFPDRIETRNVDVIRQRNKIKAACLNKLASRKTIKKMNYEVYFFSSNLEHVLHNIQKDLTKEEKMALAEKFSDEYADSPEKFLEFINSTEFAVKGDYPTSWRFIRQDCNSLNCFCNLHLFFNPT
jgi:hypothetical protein